MSGQVLIKRQNYVKLIASGNSSIYDKIMWSAKAAQHCYDRVVSPDLPRKFIDQSFVDSDNKPFVPFNLLGRLAIESLFDEAYAYLGSSVPSELPELESFYQPFLVDRPQTVFQINQRSESEVSPGGFKHEPLRISNNYTWDPQPPYSLDCKLSYFESSHQIAESIDHLKAELAKADPTDDRLVANRYRLNYLTATVLGLAQKKISKLAKH